MLNHLADIKDYSLIVILRFSEQDEAALSADAVAASKTLINSKEESVVTAMTHSNLKLMLLKQTQQLPTTKLNVLMLSSQEHYNVMKSLNNLKCH